MALMVVVWTMTSILAWYGITKLMTTFPPTTFFFSSLSRIKFPTYSIAHRGGGGENTENTMRAFAHAVHRSKTDMIELDVHLTSDGHVVIFHDANLERLTGLNKRIHDLKLSELPSLLTSVPRSTFSFDPSPSSSSSSSSYPFRRFYDIDSSVASVPENGMDQINGLPIEEFCNVKIPTLEQVFQSFPDIPINLGRFLPLFLFFVLLYFLLSSFFISFLLPPCSLPLTFIVFFFFFQMSNTTQKNSCKRYIHSSFVTTVVISSFGVPSTSRQYPIFVHLTQRSPLSLLSKEDFFSSCIITWVSCHLSLSKLTLLRYLC
jgi:hypothetical protein